MLFVALIARGRSRKPRDCGALKKHRHSLAYTACLTCLLFSKIESRSQCEHTVITFIHELTTGEPRESTDRTHSPSSLQMNTPRKSLANLAKNATLPKFLPSPAEALRLEKLEMMKGNENSKYSKRLRKEQAYEDEKRITARDHCFHWDTAPPNKAEIEYAQDLFKVTKHSPNHLWCRDSFRDIPRSDYPEVALMGRSNAGKSSLINALVGKKICNVSPKPGRTQVMNGFGIGGTKGGESKFVVVDTPGYGYGSNAVSGPELMKYLSKRQQYAPTYLPTQPYLLPHS